VTQAVLDRVEKLEISERKPIVASNFKYEWTSGSEMLDPDTGEREEDNDFPDNILAPRYGLLLSQQMDHDPSEEKVLDEASPTKMRMTYLIQCRGGRYHYWGRCNQWI